MISFCLCAGLTDVRCSLQLMPLLLRGLDLPDHEIRASVIDTLLSVADPASKPNTIVAEHASSLVKVMLKNSLFSEMPSVVRPVYID